MATGSDRYKLVFFAPAAPPESLETIKQAIFATGAGRYPGPGGYTEACFQTPGIGQFRPGATSNPTIGTPGQLEQVGEIRCEVFCRDREVAKAAAEALVKHHPYEEVAYEVYKIEDI